MKKYLKHKLSKLNLKKVQHIIKMSKQALLLEKKKSIAHLRWLADFKLRHKFDIRNKKLFKHYLTLNRKLRRYEIRHAKILLPIRA